MPLNDRVVRRFLAEERKEATLSTEHHLFMRILQRIEKNAGDMQAQVERLGGLDEALRRGAGSTLEQQLGEIESGLRIFRRRINLDK